MSIIKIANYVDESRIVFYENKDKNEVLDMLCRLSRSKVQDFDNFHQAIFDREKIISTGLGMSTAFPHVKISCIPEFFISIAIVKKAVDWDSFDGRPAKIIFMIGGPDGQQNRYLGILSKLSLMVKNEETRAAILASATAADVMKVVRKF